MGTSSSKRERSIAKRSQQRLEYDMEKIHQYLMGRTDIDDLWMQCDTNFDSKIDTEEFDDLLYHSLIYFSKMRDPMNIKVHPTRESLESKIQELSKRFNVNKDDRISRDEFKLYCDYLFDEKEKLSAEVSVTVPKFEGNV